jgi:hypothetical protein
MRIIAHNRRAPAVRVTSISKTCHSCPAQWEGGTADGGIVYIRYRWGGLRATVDSEEVYYESVGDQYDGCMSFDELKRHLAGVLAFDCEESDNAL